MHFFHFASLLNTCTQKPVFMIYFVEFWKHRHRLGDKNIDVAIKRKKAANDRNEGSGWIIRFVPDLIL